MPNAYVCLLFFRRSNQGTKVLPRTKKLYRKSYFYITAESGPDSKFRKEVYQPLERSITIVHYIGNEALSVSHAHGNTRQQAKLSVFKNFMLHDFQDWKEAPIDTLILALKCCSHTIFTKLPEENQE